MGDRETAKGSDLERGLEPSVFENRVSSAQRGRRGDLHICPECGSDLVYPTDWAPASERKWHVALRCPECEWNGGGSYSQEVVDRLDEALDHGTEAVLDDVLDVTGPPERTGKARGTDLLDGTVTLPLILAREEDPSLAKVDLRELDADGAAEVCDRVAATGALVLARADARGRVETAKHALVTSGLRREQRRLLELVADGVVERYS